MTAATTSTEINIPMPNPVLKIPPITSQLVKDNDTAKSKLALKIYFFIIF